LQDCTRAAISARDISRRPEVRVLLTELLTPDRIKIPLVSSTKDDLLRELVELIGETTGVVDVSDVLRAVRERELVLSTGIGNGVAIPHGKSASVRELSLVAGVTAEPVDFEALDGKPVRLFFLLVGPEAEAGPHVKALSRISRLLRRDPFRTRLVQASDSEEFYAILSEAELS
jgi:mannitol/fructose-specific phosphotransferase system IIA component (Ntr-type)